MVGVRSHSGTLFLVDGLFGYVAVDVVVRSWPPPVVWFFLACAVSFALACLALCCFAFLFVSFCFFPFLFSVRAWVWPHRPLWNTHLIARSSVLFCVPARYLRSRSASPRAPVRSPLARVHLRIRSTARAPRRLAVFACQRDRVRDPVPTLLKQPRSVK